MAAINTSIKSGQIRVETLGHHGLVAGFVDKLKLVERIDARLPVSKQHGSKLSHGQRIKAMIINGLGFTQNPIYLSPQFFEDKAVSLLFGEGVEAAQLNDDALGRTLDACYEYGVTALLAEIANEIHQEFTPPGRRQTLRLDSTSFKLVGEYDLEHLYLEGESRPPLPKQGYSKDHRPDLKQLVLSLIVSGPADLPIWSEGLDGNSQDKASFHATLAKTPVLPPSTGEQPGAAGYRGFGALRPRKTADSGLPLGHSGARKRKSGQTPGRGRYQ